MASDYYTHTTFPPTGSAGSSATMRAELDKIDAGFAKLPSLTGNGQKFVRINDSGTAQIVSTALSETSGAVVVSSGVLRLKFQAADSNGLLVYQDTGDKSVIKNFFASSLALGTNNTDRLTIDANGLVAINTTASLVSGSEKLAVNGIATVKATSTTSSPLNVQNADTTAATNQPYIYLNDGTAARAGLGVNFTNSTLVVSGQNGIVFRYGASGLGSAQAAVIDSSGNFILSPPTVAPTLTVNGQLVATPTSNTNLRFSYRGSDGVTRTGNLTLS